MRIVRRWAGLTAAERGASLAVGNFDGVHLGHQSVLDIARSAARDTDAPLGVLTFEPHPREFFVPSTSPFRLMGAETRANRLAKLGVQTLYELPFGAEMAGLSAEAFARDVLAEGLGARHVVIGTDFQFGEARQGN